MPDQINPENEPAASSAGNSFAAASEEQSASVKPEVKAEQRTGIRRKSGRAERKDISEMTEEEIQAPIREFKSRTLPAIVAVLGCLAAVAYMLWMFGVFGH